MCVFFFSGAKPMMSSVGGVKSQNIGLDTDEYDFYDPHWFSERSSSLSNKVKKEQRTIYVDVDIF